MGFCPQGCKRVGHDLTTKQQQGDSVGWSYLEPAHAFSFQEMEGWVFWHNWNSPITCWGTMINLWVRQRSCSIKMIHDLCCIHIVGLTGSFILCCPQVALWFVPFFFVCLSDICGFPGGSEGKESGFNKGDLVSIPGSGRSPGEGNGNPLQYSCLENPMDRGAWWAMGSQRVRPNWSD